MLSLFSFFFFCSQELGTSQQQISAVISLSMFFSNYSQKKNGRYDDCIEGRQRPRMLKDSSRRNEELTITTRPQSTITEQMANC